LLPVLQTSSTSETIRQLKDIIANEGFLKILIGLPINMDGSEGPAAKRSRDLALALERALKDEKFAGEILLHDERLTSYEAEQRLREKGIAKAKAKDFLDSIAAEVLLEDYLRSL
jgi:putative Holliday junction resolvase